MFLLFWLLLLKWFELGNGQLRFIEKVGSCIFSKNVRLNWKIERTTGNFEKFEWKKEGWRGKLDENEG